MFLERSAVKAAPCPGRDEGAGGGFEMMAMRNRVLDAIVVVSSWRPARPAFLVRHLWGGNSDIGHAASPILC